MTTASTIRIVLTGLSMLPFATLTRRGTSSMSLESSDVTKIARLARIEIQPDQVESYAAILSEILDLVEQMNEVDTSEIEAMAHPQETALRLRTDCVTEENMRERFLALSPASETGLFLVPKVIE